MFSVIGTWLSALTSRLTAPLLAAAAILGGLAIALGRARRQGRADARADQVEQALEAGKVRADVESKIQRDAGAGMSAADQLRDGWSRD